MREDFGAISSLLLLFNTNHINKHVTFEEEEEVTKKKKKKKKEIMKNGSGRKRISFGITNSLSPPSRVIRMIAQTAVVIKLSGHNRAISRTKE